MYPSGVQGHSSDVCHSKALVAGFARLQGSTAGEGAQMIWNECCKKKWQTTSCAWRKAEGGRRQDFAAAKRRRMKIRVGDPRMNSQRASAGAPCGNFELVMAKKRCPKNKLLSMKLRVVLVSSATGGLLLVASRGCSKLIQGGIKAIKIFF